MSKHLLGVPALVTYYITNLVGSGILVIPAIAQESAHQWVIGAWLFLMACAWPLARVFARIAIDFPNSNGVIHFVGHMMGQRIHNALTLGFIIIMLVGNPIMFLVGARYLIQGLSLDHELLFPISIAVMICNVAFNFLGLRYGAFLQTVLTILTISVLLGTLALTLPHANPENLRLEPFPLNGFLTALGVCFFTFLGWENVCTIAPNVRDAANSFRKAIAISVPVIGGLYLMVAIMLVLVVSSGEISGNYAVLDLLIANTGWTYAIQITNLIGFMIVFLSGNAWILAAGKLVSSAARDKLLPTWLEVGSQTTPRRAFSILALCYTIGLSLMWQFEQTEGPIAAAVSAGFIIIYILTLTAAFRYYDEPRIRQLALISSLLVTVFALSVWLQLLFALLCLGVIILYLQIHKVSRNT